MLWYLGLCARAGISVVHYVDEAEGTMIEDAASGGRFERVTLRPRVTIAGDGDVAKARELHHEAHRLCFIANSVNFPVDCEPTITRA
jgi:organic hydroperoxide reductase OsmC/OhrA